MDAITLNQSSQMARINGSLLFAILCASLLTSSNSWCYFNKFSTNSDVFEASYSPDGQYIVTAINDKRNYVYETASYSAVFTYTLPTGWICYTAKFSPDQNFLAYGLQNSTVMIFDGNFNYVTKLGTAFQVSYEVHFSPNSGKLLVCGGNGGGSSVYGYQIWSTSSWTKLKSDYTFTNFVLSCRFANSYKYAVGTMDGQIKCYNADYTWAWTAFENSAAEINGVDFSPNGSVLLTGWGPGSKKKVALYDVSNGNNVANVTVGDAIESVDYSEDGVSYAFGGLDNDLILYNGTVYGTNIATFTEPTDDVYSVDYSYDSMWLAVGSKDNKVYIYSNDCEPHKSIDYVSCPLQYYLSAPDTCLMCASAIAGCRLCPNSSTCYVCTDQYYLSGSSCVLCMTNLTACATCANATSCFSCLEPYFLFNGSCSLCYSTLPGCVVCLNQTYCSRCANNSYYLNTTSNKCVNCNVYNNCVTCNRSSCVECQQGYYSNGVSCSLCSSNCSICSASSTNCTQCDLGYYLNGNICLPCQLPCLNCTNYTACTDCRQGYYLTAPNCLPCHYSCAQCSVSASTCSLCNIGYYLAGTTCSRCQSGCASCFNSTGCLSCMTGHYLNGPSSCLSCSSLHPLCLSCRQSECWQCSVGSFLNSSTCANCSELIEGCQLCNGTSSCLLCYSHYYLNGQNCVKCIWPCLTCSASTTCLSCGVGYFLNSSSACEKCSCPTCSSSTACLSCYIGEYLHNGDCLSCSLIHPLCLSCFNDSTCSECYPPYYLSGSNCSYCPQECSSCNSSVCLTCHLGFYLNSGSCSPCSFNCTACVDGSNCSMCLLGHYLSNTNTCQECGLLFQGCQSCIDSQCFLCDYSRGYFLNGSSCGICHQKVPMCSRCNGSDCLACQVSYALNSSQCLPCTILLDHCSICTNSSFCSQCSNGFYPSSGTCLLCTNGCFSCTGNLTCTKCFDEFLLDSGGCFECGSLLIGCDRCSSSAVCQNCAFGYYLDSSACVPCLRSINGCLACYNQTDCIVCESGYYLDPTGTCLSCGDNITGCSFCRNASVCDVCQGGYFLSAVSCSLCGDPYCLNCNSSHCVQCLSGHYLSGPACLDCQGAFTGCIFCNSTQCLSCQSGYYLTGGTCVFCPLPGCQTCDPFDSGICLSCNSGYYLSAGVCSLCSTAMVGCSWCSSLSACLECHQGYYITASGCGLCSSSIQACRSCSNSSLCLSCDNGYFLNSSICSLCADQLYGCSYCQVSTICLSCLQGYYLNTSSFGCHSCTDLQGCLICRDSTTCNYCNEGYYLSSGICVRCNSSLTSCAGCSSNTVCHLCEGDYELSGHKCVIITPGVDFYKYQELSLKSRYINASTLSHTLWVKGTTFQWTSADLSLHANISYLTDGGIVVNLTVYAFAWGTNNDSIIFYTNNPFDFQSGNGAVSSMKLFNMRLLATSSFQLNTDFRLAMDEATVQTLLPYASHGGNLFLSYNINQPQFTMSTISIRQYYYHFFGIILTAYVLVFYFIKAVVVDPEGRDKGQLIAHLLLVKSIVLMVYPAYGELINYCAGFMVADLPWLNAFFGQLFSNPTDATPLPYLLFYVSLSIASTYLTALLAITAIAVVLAIAAYMSPPLKPTVKNMAGFFYCFFIGGLALACVCCVQGAFLNLVKEFTIKSGFYLLGMVGWLILLGEAVWSSYQASDNLFKVRLMVKVTLISLMHYSAVYLCAAILAAQIFFLFLQWRLVQRRFPKLWLGANVLPNLALLLLVQLSHSLVSLYVASGMLLGALFLEFVIVLREYRLNKLSGQLRIEGETKNNFIHTLGVLNKEQEKHDFRLANSMSFNDGFMLGDSVVEIHEKAIPNDSHQNFFAIEELLK